MGSDEKGLSRITTTGRTAFLLALIGLYSTIQQSIDKHKHVIATQQLNEAAARELNDEFNQLIQPFLFVIHMRSDSTIKKHGELWITKSYDQYTFFDSLVNQQLLDNEKVDSIDFYGIPDKTLAGAKLANRPIWQIFSLTYAATKAKVDNTLANFSLFVPEEVRLDIYKIFTSNPDENGFFDFVTEDLPVIASNDSLHREHLGFLFWSYLVSTDSCTKKQSFLYILGDLKKRLSVHKTGNPCDMVKN
jgi:hypothetical protein